MDNELGNIKISDDVLAVCAARAALHTQGVAGFASAVFTETISESILKKASESKGVKISQNENEITADLYIIVKYGVTIPTVAWNIQENVKKELEKVSGMKVALVNIHVQGIRFPKDEATPREQKRRKQNEQQKQ